MLVLWLVLATVPLWIARVGLYQYLGIEIMIWTLFALGFNLLLGTAGLPSFGHGAYFGIGAYAFGLLPVQRRRPISGSACWRAFVVAGWPARWSALFISHRRGIYYALLTIAFGQVFWFARDQVAQASPAARTACSTSSGCRPISASSRSTSPSNVAFFYFVLVVFALGRGRAVAPGPFAVRPRARGDPAERDPRRASSATTSGSTSGSVFTLSAAVAGLAGGLFAMAQQAAFPDVMSLHQSGYRRDDGAGRRRPGQLLGPVVGVFLFLLARDVLGA